MIHEFNCYQRGWEDESFLDGKRYFGIHVTPTNNMKDAMMEAKGNLREQPEFTNIPEPVIVCGYWEDEHMSIDKYVGIDDVILYS